MFVDTQETSFLHDLSKPGLNALSHILRHRELWPKEFWWNYTDCDTCAVGLARKLWRLSNDLNMEKVFDIPSFAVDNIFFAWNDWYEDIGVPFVAVTPRYGCGPDRQVYCIAMNPAPGQIWKDNDPRYDRYVLIKGVGSNFVRVIRVNEDGSELSKGYSTSSSLKRFRTAGRNGYTFVRAK